MGSSHTVWVVGLQHGELQGGLAGEGRGHPRAAHAVLGPETGLRMASGREVTCWAGLQVTNVKHQLQ